jgi:AcrR family transcriptional regulator
MSSQQVQLNKTLRDSGRSELFDLPRRSLLHLPKQSRSARRVHAILDAAIDVLVEKGAEEFNTNRVAEQAGVSVGSIYQYFPNKQRILSGIIERGLLNSEQFLRALAVERQGEALEVLVEEGLLGLVALLGPHRDLLEELFLHATPFGEESVFAPIEETLMGVAKDWMIANADEVRLAHGSATLYVGLRAGIFIFLRWLVEQPHEVPMTDFVPSLARHITLGVERRTS